MKNLLKCRSTAIVVPKMLSFAVLQKGRQVNCGKQSYNVCFFRCSPVIAFYFDGNDYHFCPLFSFIFLSCKFGCRRQNEKWFVIVLEIFHGNHSFVRHWFKNQFFSLISKLYYSVYLGSMRWWKWWGKIPPPPVIRSYLKLCKCESPFKNKLIGTKIALCDIQRTPFISQGGYNIPVPYKNISRKALLHGKSQ